MKVCWGSAIGLVVMVLGLNACGGGGSDSGRPSQADTGSLLVPLPDDSSRSGVELFPRREGSTAWRVMRQWPAGEILVYRKVAESWVARPFQAGSRSLALQVLEASGALYVFVYDVESNVPSGRNLTGVFEGIDVWRFDPEGGDPIRYGQGLPLGALENAIYVRERNGALDACALDSCVRLSGSGVVRWNTDAIAGYPLAGYEIVDLRFEGEEAHAIVRPLDDHFTGDPDYRLVPYAIARLRVDGSTVQPLPRECLPFALTAVNGAPEWRCANSVSDYADILRHDLARQPHGGLGDFGLPNTEGRIAWSLVYSLNALLDVNLRDAPRLAAARDWSVEQAQLREALSLVARQHTAAPSGYAARRYSIDRSPLLFALHLSRIAHLLARAEEFGFGSPEIGATLAGLRAAMVRLQGTAEEPIVESGYQTLGFRRGIAFWADGANVPFNYVSDYVLGLLAAATNPQDEVPRAAALLQALQELEPVGSEALWHYWWGRGRNGWQASDGVSVNTPTYAGQPGVAHITYRSHDAMALFRLASLEPTSVPPATVDHLRSLVAEGRLLPFVNEELTRTSRAAAISTSAARRYGRSAAPWELQAQVWALEALAAQ